MSSLLYVRLVIHTLFTAPPRLLAFENWSAVIHALPISSVCDGLAARARHQALRWAGLEMVNLGAEQSEKQRTMEPVFQESAQAFMDLCALGFPAAVGE
jgi:hypothetical protein